MNGNIISNLETVHYNKNNLQLFEVIKFRKLNSDAVFSSLLYEITLDQVLFTFKVYI
jgi:hypothetical protein